MSADDADSCEPNHGWTQIGGRQFPNLVISTDYPDDAYSGTG